MRHLLSSVATVITLFAAVPAMAGTVRVALGSDPDILDPAIGGSYDGRVVFAALCDKLVDIDAKLQFVPQLATEWSWAEDARSLTLKLRQDVTFHDGERLDAAAVKANIERYKTMPESRRKAELALVAGVEVVDPSTVRLQLSQPYAPLVAVLSDRAGMMVSPKHAAATGPQAGERLVCSGPYRFVERVAQDRIVLDRNERYWNPKPYTIDRMVYLAIPDSNVRLANLRAGQLEIAEQIAPTDLAEAKRDARVKIVESPSIAYNTFSFNLNHGEQANTPFGRDPRVREAFELAIDRNVINEVVFNGAYIPNNQPQAPGTDYYVKELPMPTRDVARAKQLLAASGTPRVALTLGMPNAPVALAVAQVIQSMAGEAGFDIKIEALEASTLTNRSIQGDYQATFGIWSGRADPDGNISIWLACDGFLNWGKYCDPKLDELLGKAQATPVPAERYGFYRDAAKIYLAARPHMILYHLKWFWGLSAKVEGFNPHPDGLIRLGGTTLRP
ncbi:MAG: ABC transporter substrate-binding protein [Proteobacteria bacterium]|nr:ABC transporter substrate-binding protein [Pseudomonadota bacterium]MBI3495956.1 ABC transporter substrate-binding protein [Pseudomonadota bacterium]